MKALQIQENIAFSYFRKRQCKLSFFLTFQKAKKNLLFIFVLFFLSLFLVGFGGCVFFNIPFSEIEERALKTKERDGG